MLNECVRLTTSIIAYKTPFFVFLVILHQCIFLCKRPHFIWRFHRRLARCISPIARLAGWRKKISFRQCMLRSNWLHSRWCIFLTRPFLCTSMFICIIFRRQTGRQRNSLYKFRIGGGGCRSCGFVVTLLLVVHAITTVSIILGVFTFNFVTGIGSFKRIMDVIISFRQGVSIIVSIAAFIGTLDSHYFGRVPLGIYGPIKSSIFCIHTNKIKYFLLPINLKQKCI